MAANVWCVKPESVRIDLAYTPPGETERKFWIEIKKHLTVGEERRIMTAGWKGMSRSEESGETGINIDWKAQTFARTETFLTDWSLKDDGVPLSRASIEALSSDVYALIETAINAHVEAMVEEKKAKSGSSAPSPTSE